MDEMEDIYDLYEQNNWEKLHESKIAFKREIATYIFQNETIIFQNETMVVFLELFKRGNFFGTPGTYILFSLF